MKKTVTITLFIILMVSITPLHSWDDFVLLTSAAAQLKPNIMFMLDNSGSMNTVILPTFYDPNHTYAGPGCDFIDPSKTYIIKKFGNSYFFVELGKESTKLEALGKIPQYDYAVEMNLKDCDNKDSFSTNQEIYFYPLAESQEEPRYPGNFLNFLIYNATLGSNGTNYLDDLAYFAYDYDLYPDEMLKDDVDFEEIYQNKQFIYTYYHRIRHRQLPSQTNRQKRRRRVFHSRQRHLHRRGQYTGGVLRYKHRRLRPGIRQWR